MQTRRSILKAAAGAICAPAAALARAPTPRATSGLSFIERGGRDPAVLFIHGWAQSSVYWAEWVDLLGGCGVHALAVDLPGFGGSATLPGPYTLEALADAVAGFVHAHRLGRVTLVGGSMGSTVAQFVTLRHPRLVRRLVLAATSPGAAPPSGGRAAPRTREQARQAYQNTAEVDRFFYAGHPPEDHADRFYGAFRQMKFEAGFESNQSNSAWSTIDRLHEIRVPTLVIQGAQDTGKTPAKGALVAGRIPDARLVVLDRAAHTPQWDQPDAFRRAALPFIMEGAARGARCV